MPVLVTPVKPENAIPDFDKRPKNQAPEKSGSFHLVDMNSLDGKTVFYGLKANVIQCRGIYMTTGVLGIVPVQRHDIKQQIESGE